MKLTFVAVHRTVTGTLFIGSGRKKILLDCGMFQGGKNCGSAILVTIYLIRRS